MKKTKSFIKIFTIAAVLSLLMLLYFFADARYSHIFPRCIFYSLTNFYCPGCGSQRAFSSLLHGELLQAFNYNILFIMCLPLLLYSAFVTVLNAFRKKQLVQRLFYSAFFVRFFLLAVITFWIARNIPFYPFNLLAPGAVKYSH